MPTPPDHPPSTGLPGVVPARERPHLAISMGDPLGIGPEVIVRALADRQRRRRGRFLIHGLAEPMAMAAEACGIEPFWWRVPAGSHLLDTTLAHDVVLLDHGAESGWGEMEWASMRREACAAGGGASFRFVEASIEDALRSPGDPGSVDAIATAPISKAAWALAGQRKYPGHTDLLARRFGCKRTRMMFVSPRLRVILVTAHIPLMELRNVLTIGRVFDTIDLGVEACRLLGIESARVAVCGVNPHAGEDGLMGDEEERLIKPAMRMAEAAGMRVSGPWPGDTVFRGAIRGEFDLVVAMYHDQGLIAVKTTAFDEAVNVTIGLPTVRTSPDHGTAFDIAGRGVADAGSMGASIDLALSMAEARRAAPGDASVVTR